ncbi:hypothetical protein G7054_g700 [Neopestalotiopsis clavispora]|nr:hypothetical protein G7054_g700 [Neopestalotiopsis clavispora]
MGYSFDDILADPGEGRIVIISIVTVPLCILTTILRLFAPKPPGTRFRWDDLFAFLALLGFLVYACMPFVGVAVAGDLTDDELAVLVAKLSYICTPFFYINQFFARGSLFALYYRIFWSDRAFVRWIYALATIHVCWFITFFLMVIFLCRPISKWWDIVGDQPGYCIDGNVFLIAEETTNSLLDFALIALTVGLIRKLATRSYVKAKLIFVFIIGGLSGVIGFVKIGLVYSVANTNGQENDTNAFWDILQMATSIFCACAPMAKTIVPLVDLWTRLKSCLASRYSKTQSSDPGTVDTMSSGSRSPEAYGMSSRSGYSFKWPRFLGSSPVELASEFELQPIHQRRHELHEQSFRDELETPPFHPELGIAYTPRHIELEMVEHPVQLP